MSEPSPEHEALRLWMAEYQRGSLDAFERLYAALAPELTRYLGALARDAARADDLVQETFLQIHRARAAHIPGQPVRPWVFAIAKRVFLMDQRGAARRSRREGLSVAVPETQTAVTTTDRLHARREVASALRQVPADRLRPFLLHHLFGFSFREIGVRLGIKPGAAKVQSSRAAGLMRAFLRRSRHD